MEKHNVLLKGVIKVSSVTTTSLDPNDPKDKEKLEEEFTRHLRKVAEGMTTPQTMTKVNKYDTIVEEIPNSLS